ncbi:MAG: gamma-glutamylcyclotransferase family protein [Bacteroidota bacterium]
MVNRLFVYGTLCPGQPNDYLLKAIGGEWQPGTVTGKLIEIGWGAAMGYPGISLDQSGAEVNGFLFNSDNLENHWPELDAFEGEGYERVLTQVKLADKTLVEAYIYSVKPPQ